MTKRSRRRDTLRAEFYRERRLDSHTDGHVAAVLQWDYARRDILRAPRSIRVAHWCALERVLREFLADEFDEPNPGDASGRAAANTVFDRCRAHICELDDESIVQRAWRELEKRLREFNHDRFSSRPRVA